MSAPRMKKSEAVAFIEAFNKLRVACIVLIDAVVKTLQAASIITPTPPPK